MERQALSPSRPPRTRRDYWLLAQATLAVGVARISLLLAPLAKTRQIVRILVGSCRPLPPHQRCSVEKVVRAAVSASLHSPVGTTCLSTALVAQAMLQRHGHVSRLRLGVRRDSGGKFAAHAWLEHEGTVVVGGPTAEIASYTALPEMEHLIR